MRSLTVNSESIDRSNLLSPCVSELKKNDLKRCHSWGASLNRIGKRKTPLNKPPTKGILYFFCYNSIAYDARDLGGFQ